MIRQERKISGFICFRLNLVILHHFALFICHDVGYHLFFCRRIRSFRFLVEDFHLYRFFRLVFFSIYPQFYIVGAGNLSLRKFQLPDCLIGQFFCSHRDSFRQNSGYGNNAVRVLDGAQCFCFPKVHCRIGPGFFHGKMNHSFLVNRTARFLFRGIPADAKEL